MVNFQIAVDTREQLPYKFKNSVTKTLQSGDYSIIGHESQIAIERKTKGDAYGSLGQGRKRFENEFKRLSVMSYAAVVIECSLSNFLKQPKHSQLNPKSAINTLISWCIKYGVQVHFAENRKLGRALTAQLLAKWWKSKGE